MPKGVRSSLPRKDVVSQAPPEVFDLYRAGVKGALDWMKACLENAERLQNQQLIVMQSAMDAQLQAASQLGAAMTSLYEKQMASLNKAGKDTSEAR
jgi:leucyl aminopeptidase (aminopeptidase T)